MTPKKQLKVTAIENGTVIDHLPCENAFKIVRVLELDSEENENVMLLGLNLESNKLGRKGIIKIAGRFFTHSEINKIALLAPDAVINIIRDFRVSQKDRPRIPDVIEGIVHCPNGNCITNHDRVTSRFITERRKPLVLRCHYCERSISKQDITLL